MQGFFRQRLMYYPVQIPYILSKPFAEFIRYSEEIIESFQNFVICLWDMQPVSEQRSAIENIIVADGCIDLVADFDRKQIGFVGMSKTDFDFKIESPSYFMGARLKPGVFYAITGIPASAVMDSFLPVDEIDKNFNANSFFELSFNEAKKFFRDYTGLLIQNIKPNDFILLFDKFSDDIPDSVSEIYQMVNYSPKQCQRLFSRHFGLTPQMVLCIIRFQKCLEILTSTKASPSDVLNLSNYYDQSHFINDFKKNIGLTPFELMNKYLN